MSLQPQPTIRAFDKGGITNIFSLRPWASDITAETELWLILKSYSEVQIRGLDLLKIQGNSNYAKLKKWKVFRAFIRQAEIYWEAANKTARRASALLYYYCFLNLVKAFFTLKKPMFYKLEEHLHGLRHLTSSMMLEVKKNRFEQQIFAQYYNQIFGINDKGKIPDKLNIDSLFSFTTSISDQVIDSGIGVLRTIPFRLGLAIDTRYLKKAWYVLAVKGGINW